MTRFLPVAVLALLLVACASEDTANPRSTVLAPIISAPAARVGPVLIVEDWNCSTEPDIGYSYFKGLVTNNSASALSNVLAVGTWFDSQGGFITSENALIDYDPLLPGQTSPFEVIIRWNPAMEQCQLEFSEFFGGLITSAPPPTPTPTATPLPTATIDPSFTATPAPTPRPTTTPFPTRPPRPTSTPAPIPTATPSSPPIAVLLDGRYLAGGNDFVRAWRWFEVRVLPEPNQPLFEYKSTALEEGRIPCYEKSISRREQRDVPTGFWERAGDPIESGTPLVIIDRSDTFARLQDGEFGYCDEVLYLAEPSRTHDAQYWLRRVDLADTQ